MGQDGLLFGVFGRVHPTTRVPLIGTVVTGLFAGVIAFLLDIEVLGRRWTAPTSSLLPATMIGFDVCTYRSFGLGVVWCCVSQRR